MKTKFYSYLLFASLAVASLACSLSLPGVNRLDTGPTQTFELNEPAPGADAVQEIELSMMAGEFHLSGGTDALLDGQIRYNVEEWMPVVMKGDNSVTVSQGELDASTLSIPQGDITNNWDVKLGNYPMNLAVHAGAYEANLALGGLPIRRLEIRDGASTAKISFDTPNPEVMDSLSYHTGASDVSFSGLANANFQEMSFEGGAGNYTFDFSGDLQQDASITIDVGLSDLEIQVPTGVSARVEVDSGLSQLDTTGTWSKDGGSYVSEGDGPTLTIMVKMGAGNLRLVNE
jgi:hypothetical protein